jgi:transposase
LHGRHSGGFGYDFEKGERVKKRKTYSGAFKARILRELLNGRRDLKELSERHGLHPNQIKNWKSLLLKRAALTLEDRRHR